MERHLTWGMDAAFIVKNGDTAKTSIRQPPAYLPPCRVPFRSWLQNSDGSDEKENESILI
jgi:laccase